MLRKRLECHNFEWYLTNIWQDHFFPTDDRFFGKIMLIDANSEQHYEYLNCLRNFDLSQYTNWPYVIDYFNQRTSEFSPISQSLKGFCIQRPNAQGIMNVPYGQARLSACGNETHVEDFFVITNDGHVNSNQFFIKIQFIYQNFYLGYDQRRHMYRCGGKNGNRN